MEFVKGLFDVRDFGHARTAPGRPEIHQNNLGLELGQVHHAAIERSELDFRRMAYNVQSPEHGFGPLFNVLGRIGRLAQFIHHTARLRRFHTFNGREQHEVRLGAARKLLNERPRAALECLLRLDGGLSIRPGAGGIRFNFKSAQFKTFILAQPGRFEFLRQDNSKPVVRFGGPRADGLQQHLSFNLSRLPAVLALENPPGTCVQVLRPTRSLAQLRGSSFSVHPTAVCPTS